ncbi:MAG: DUF211 domain-containing protein [Candidatus Thermoplasmatota archaeon]|jgi:hypothetical protein|nr:DUF211 domain-containing protein [Candidatus Thermoplasmatota archaeon]MCL5793688.1 DUF211 domain-containing protein [Candidatus Thermoplasmatota archaeon]
MNVRRIVLDVDKSLNRPTLMELASAIENVQGVEALNISVNEIDMETMGTVIAIEGTKINVDQLITAIEDTGSVVHSIDEIATGARILSSVQTRQ